MHFHSITQKEPKRISVNQKRKNFVYAPHQKKRKTLTLQNALNLHISYHKISGIIQPSKVASGLQFILHCTVKCIYFCINESFLTWFSFHFPFDEYKKDREISKMEKIAMEIELSTLTTKKILLYTSYTMVKRSKVIEWRNIWFILCSI